MVVLKRKVVGLALAGILTLTGVASAASMWGTYKGNDIIRLTVDNAPVKVSDVPAISYNNRTMIPINLLKEAGVSYTWDGANKTVNITKQKPITQTTTVYVGEDIKSYMTYLKKYTDVNNVQYVETKTGSYIYVEYNGTVSTITDSAMNALITPANSSQVDTYYIGFNDGQYFSLQTSKIKQYFSQKITYQQLIDSLDMSGITSSSSSTTGNSNNSQSSLSYDPVTCQNIIDLQSRRGSYYSGGTVLQLQNAGCPIPNDLKTYK